MRPSISPLSDQGPVTPERRFPGDVWVRSPTPSSDLGPHPIASQNHSVSSHRMGRVSSQTRRLAAVQGNGSPVAPEHRPMQLGSLVFPKTPQTRFYEASTLMNHLIPSLREHPKFRENLEFSRDNIIARSGTHPLAFITEKEAEKHHVVDRPTMKCSQDHPLPFRINVVNRHAFGAAKWLDEKEPNQWVGLVNPGHPDGPATAFSTGNWDHEAVLCIGSTLFDSLNVPNRWNQFELPILQHPLPTDAVISCPSVLVFRELYPNYRAYPSTADYFWINVITVIPVINPEVVIVEDDAGEVLGSEHRHDHDRQLLSQQLSWALKAAVEQGCKRLVLTPLGFEQGHPADFIVMMLIVTIDKNMAWLSKHGLEEVAIAISEDEEELWQISEHWVPEGHRTEAEYDLDTSQEEKPQRIGVFQLHEPNVFEPHTFDEEWREMQGRKGDSYLSE